MANTVLTPSVISKETLTMLGNNLVAASKVNRQFENQFVKIGSTLTVRKPNKFTVSSGPALQIQNITEPSTSITISNQKHVDFQFSETELTLAIEEFSERYLKPASEPLANKIDFDVLGLYNQAFNLVGTPGTTPNAFSFLAAVGQRMDEGAVPQDDRCLVLGPAAYWSMAAGLSGLYVTSVAEPALKGFLAKIANFSIYEDQNVQAQTVGALGGSGQVNGAGQTGSSLITNGWSNSVTGLLNQGDVFTIAGVNAVNPQNFQSTGVLQNFVVTATANSDGSGNSTIGIYPSIVTSGPYQTVDSSPANSAAITVKGSASTKYPQNLAFTRDAFGLVTVPLEMPSGVDFAARNEYRGISMRILRAYDVNNDVVPCRVDILYGLAAYYPELVVRLTG
ncbi:MAG TPA: P22 phage major capsid protein family protein [Stellaceae bacterium]|nr:P22 phage major capsid protein family protein [Stellaceae bacterium]